VPVSEHRYRRRVEFADTDMAGVVHFSWIAKYMEEAEHALWREAGLSIVPQEAAVSFPRVALSIDFKAPLFFEDEFEVHVRLTAASQRSLTYAHTIRRGDTVIATGTMTAVCVRKSPLPMKAVEIPSAILDRLAIHSSA
jgi:acyl-CoA thioester hydrolase